MASMTAFVRRISADAGSELIEMAMVTPILLLIVGGIVDFGFLFRAWENVTNAAREGARVGILPSYGCALNDPNIKDRVKEYMDAAGITDTGSYTVSTGPSTVATGAGSFTACTVVVKLTQPLPSLGVFGAFFGGAFGSLPVASAAVMRAESQAGPAGP